MLSIVLSRQDFKECDQIVSLYTLERGKVEVLAKGAKKIISKNAAFLLPFFCIEAETVEGKEVTRLLRAQPVKSYKNIRADLSKSLAAGFVVDFLNKSLHPGAPDKELFDLLGGWLDFLDTEVVFQPIILDAFFVKLYKILGFDIVEVAKSSVLLKFLRSENWLAICEFKAEGNEADQAHRDILKFMEHHTEKPVRDWIEPFDFLANFSGI